MILGKYAAERTFQSLPLQVYLPSEPSEGLTTSGGIMQLDTTRLKKLFGKTERFTEEDLKVLREDVAMIGHFSSKADYVEVRMSVELIDAIGRLDATSTRLIKTTNWLSVTILALTVVGVVVAILAYIKA